jgi:hypothetical protein
MIRKTIRDTLLILVASQFVGILYVYLTMRWR